jgi:hypothetical protein
MAASTKGVKDTPKRSAVEGSDDKTSLLEDPNIRDSCTSSRTTHCNKSVTSIPTRQRGFQPRKSSQPPAEPGFARWEPKGGPATARPGNGGRGGGI